jgi:hypothetical protein
MSDFLSRMDGGQLIGLVAVVGGLLVVVLGILTRYWHKGRLTALKRDMLDRGMSADEIHAVITATPGKDVRGGHLSRA